MKLTKEQMETVKMMTEFGQAVLNQMYHIMQNHGLDKIEGCQMTLYVAPEYDNVTCNIDIGRIGTDFGNVSIARGKKSSEYYVYGRNSPEYELLFASQELAEKLKHKDDKPLPSDGMWV